MAPVDTLCYNSGKKPNVKEITLMGYSDIIAREAETLPLEKQVEILDFIAFLKTRQFPVEAAPGTEPPRTTAAIEAFFRSFNVDTRGYTFNREDANAR
jgi:hypothetical protein